MTTVPNWIAKGYAYRPCADGGAFVYPIRSWRATRTQVVVELSDLAGEYRFRLDDLRYAYTRQLWRDMVLVPPGDERLRGMPGSRVERAAARDLTKVIDSTPLDPSTMNAEALVIAIGRIQRAATKALADLAEVL